MTLTVPMFVQSKTLSHPWQRSYATIMSPSQAVWAITQTPKRFMSPYFQFQWLYQPSANKMYPSYLWMKLLWPSQQASSDWRKVIPAGAKIKAEAVSCSQQTLHDGCKSTWYTSSATMAVSANGPTISKNNAWRVKDKCQPHSNISPAAFCTSWLQHAVFVQPMWICSKQFPNNIPQATAASLALTKLMLNCDGPI